MVLNVLDIVYQIVNWLDCPSICKSKYISKIWWSVCKAQIKKLNIKYLLFIKSFVSNNFYNDAILLNKYNVCMINSLNELYEYTKTKDMSDLRWVILYNSIHKKIIYTNTSFMLDDLKFNVQDMYNQIVQFNVQKI